MTWIPCLHAFRVIVCKNFKPEDYVPNWYLTTWRKQYSDPV